MELGKSGRAAITAYAISERGGDVVAQDAAIALLHGKFVPGQLEGYRLRAHRV